MSERRLMVAVIIFALALIAVVNWAFPGSGNHTSNNTVERTSDGTRVYPESQMNEALASDESNVVIRLDDEPLPSQDEIAALPACEELLASLERVPQIGDERQCRSNGRKTPIAVALEDSDIWELGSPGAPMRRKTSSR